MDDKSIIDITASFADPKDKQFALLVQDPLFWSALFSTKNILQSIRKKELWRHCSNLAIHAYIVFSLTHKYGMAAKKIAKDMAELFPRKKLEEEDVKAILNVLTLARTTWDNGKIRGSPETYPPLLRRLLTKVQRDTKISDEEQSVILSNAMTRINENKSLHHLQDCMARELHKQLEDMSENEAEKRIQQILTQALTFKEGGD